MAVTTPRLPGLRFETVRPPAAPALPRMDIAAFAGFTARGPVGVPVPVEDVVRFEEVFGGDLPLAWDVSGRPARAHLPQAVREFFRNGGRRCWVVRLAREPEQARFLLPGLLRVRGGEVLGAAWATASSPGSWADAVRVNATLLRTGLGDAVTIEPGDPDGPAIRVADVGARDLVRLELGDGTLGFFPPRPARFAADSTAEERRASALRPVSDSCWFEPTPPASLPRGSEATLHALEDGSMRPVPLGRWEAGDVALFEVAADAVGELRPGSWLRLDLPGSADGRLRPEVYLVLDEVERAQPRSRLIARRAWRALVRDPAWSRAEAEGFRASLVSVELWAVGDAAPARIPDVALAPGHPRWFGLFPDDGALYPAVGGPPGGHDVAEGGGSPPVHAVDRVEQGAAPLRAELASPRFPLAAPAETLAGGEVLVPLGVEALPRDEFEQPARTSGRSAMERDGLDRVDAALFLDPDLGALPAVRILEEAFRIQHGDGARRRLRGVHALLPVEEASILAVPDAVQRGWTLRDGAVRAPASPPDHPRLRPLEPLDGGMAVEADWSPRPAATGYEVEWGPDPRFRGPVDRRLVQESRTRIDLPGTCPDRLYVRVRAHSEAGPSTWSRTRLWAGPAHGFHRCDRDPLEAPALRPPRQRRGELRLRWRGDGETYRVEGAADLSFADARPVYEGPLRETAVWVPRETTYFRVAAAAGAEQSPWSITRVFRPRLDDRWEVIPPGEAAAAAAGVDPVGRLLDIHASMLRLCAARSDMVSILALPSDHRETDAVTYAERLRGRVGGVDGTDDTGLRVPSFGALYHPWPMVPGAHADTPVRSVPPDGSISGLLAARSLEAGAWAVPANRALGGVVALEPRLGPDARAAFLERQVNGLVPYPDGFTVWSEETLSTDPELVGLGVRRLLILLRRIALREGHRYLFQPNSGPFRRLVQRQFDRVLAGLFARGAFAGRTPEEGYRVLTGEAVNPPSSVDQGRFVVELRVAPSRPLHFLVVRLVQTGAGLTVMEG